MILVCGDTMLDHYQWVEVMRLSPDAPVPVLKIIEEEIRSGAASNVANQITSMGGKCEVLFGSGEPIVKVRIVAKRGLQHIARIDYDHEQQPVNENLFRQALEVCRYVLFCDYSKGSLRNIDRLIKIAKRFNRYVLIDPKGHDYRKYAGADLIKPNQDEMKELVGGWSSEEELSGKALALLDDAELGAILLTRAADGMTLFERSGSIHLPIEPKEVVCVSGAGESAIAAVAVALDKGYFLHEAIGYGNKAAGVAVGRFGTSLVTEEEVFGVRGPDLKAD